MRRRSRAVVGVLIVMIAVVGAPVRPASAATTLTVEAGYAGTYVPGRPLPVRVKVTADRLLAADLQVSVDGPATSVGIEVPGGTTKEFLVVVPTSGVESGVATATATLPGVSAATATAEPARDQEVVGLLPGALAGRAVPGPAPLAVDVGTARFVELTPLVLDRAPDSLMSLGTIGVGGDELARQSTAIREAVLHWVESGGHLLIDAEAGSGPVPGLPDEWQPGPTGRARAGGGEIRLTSGAMAGGRWANLVEPTARTGDTVNRGFGGPPLGDLLANEAGFRVAKLSWLVAYLVLYVAIVGPVLYFVLRRWHRPELAWVAVPLIALLFTGGSWAGGRGLRNATPAVHGTVLVTGAHGSTALTYVGVSSPSGSTSTVAYPQNWLTGARDIFAPERATTLVKTTHDGVEGRLPLDPGQFAMISARGPVAVEGTLAVTATAVDREQVKGTVRNTTGMAFDGVAVMVGSATTSVGALEPGEQREWTARAVENQLQRPFNFDVWGMDQRGPVAGDEGWKRYSLWSAATAAGLVGTGGGRAVAAGWTTEYTPPVKVDGNAVRRGGQTIVVGSSPVQPGTGPVNELAIRADLVRSNEFNQGRAVVRLGLPPEQAGTAAKLSLRVTSFPAEVWSGGAQDGWTPLECPPNACAVPARMCPPGVPCPVPPPGAFMMGGTFDVPLPAGALKNGAVYLRFSAGLPETPFGTSFPALREAT